MSNRLFGFLVLLFLLAGLFGVSAVEPGCTPAPRKTSHGEIMVEWEDAKLLAVASNISFRNVGIRSINADTLVSTILHCL